MLRDRRAVSALLLLLLVGAHEVVAVRLQSGGPSVRGLKSLELLQTGTAAQDLSTFDVLFTPAILVNVGLTIAKTRNEMQQTAQSFKRLDNIFGSLGKLIEDLKKENSGSTGLMFSRSMTNQIVETAFLVQYFKESLGGAAPSAWNIITHYSKMWKLEDVEKRLEWHVNLLAQVRMSQTQEMIAAFTDEYRANNAVSRTTISTAIRDRAITVQQDIKNALDEGFGDITSILKQAAKDVDAAVVDAFINDLALALKKSEYMMGILEQLESYFKNDAPMKRLMETLGHIETTAKRVFMGESIQTSKFLGAVGQVLYYIGPNGKRCTPDFKYKMLKANVEHIESSIIMVENLLQFYDDEDNSEAMLSEAISQTRDKDIKSKIEAVRQHVSSSIWKGLMDHFSELKFKEFVERRSSQMTKEKKMCKAGLNGAYMDCRAHQITAGKACVNTKWFVHLALKYVLVGSTQNLEEICAYPLGPFYGYLTARFAKDGVSPQMFHPMSYTYRHENLDINDICRYWTWTQYLTKKESKQGSAVSSTASTASVVAAAVGPDVCPMTDSDDEDGVGGGIGGRGVLPKPLSAYDLHRDDINDRLNTNFMPQAAFNTADLSLSTSIDSNEFFEHLKVYTTCNQDLFEAAHSVLDIIKNIVEKRKREESKVEIIFLAKRVLFNIGNLNACFVSRSIDNDVQTLDKTSPAIMAGASAVYESLATTDLSESYGPIANNIDANDMARSPGGLMSATDFPVFAPQFGGVEVGVAMNVESVLSLVVRLNAAVHGLNKEKYAKSHNAMGELLRKSAVLTKYDRTRLILRQSIKEAERSSRSAVENCVSKKREADDLCYAYGEELAKTCEDTLWGTDLKVSLREYGQAAIERASAKGASDFNADLLKYSEGIGMHLQGLMPQSTLAGLDDMDLDELVEQIVADLNEERMPPSSGEEAEE